MSFFGDGYKGVVFGDPVPGVAESVFVYCGVEESVELEYGDVEVWDFFGCFGGEDGPYGAVVVEHAIEGGAFEGCFVACFNFCGFFSGDHVRDHLRVEHFVCVWRLKVFDVFGVGFLFGGCVCANGCVSLGVGEVADDEFVYAVGVEHCEAPGNCAAPVVSYEGYVVYTEVFNDGIDICEEDIECEAGNVLGLVGFVVAACIHSDDFEVFFEAFHLVAPGVPEIGESVYEEYDGAFAGADVV